MSIPQFSTPTAARDRRNHLGRLRPDGRVEAAIAMGYVDTAHAVTGTAVACDLRGKALAVQVVAIPRTASLFQGLIRVENPEGIEKW